MSFLFFSSLCMDFLNSIWLSIEAITFIVSLCITTFIFFSIVFWKILEKTGNEWWKILIPFYNLYVVVKLCWRPGWWYLFFFIPFVNIIITIILTLDLAKRFWKNTMFWFGLLFVGIIFYPLLAFDESVYLPPEKKEMSDDFVL